MMMMMMMMSRSGQGNVYCALLGGGGGSLAIKYIRMRMANAQIANVWDEVPPTERKVCEMCFPIEYHCET